MFTSERVIRISAPSALRCNTFSVDILSGNHQQHAIAFGARDQRETEARVAGSGLHDSSAGFRAAVRFGGRDHGKGDAVLDRAARVLTFQLDEQAAAADVESSDLDQRRVADQAQDGRIAARGVG